MKRQMVIGPLLVAAMAGGIYCETASARGWGGNASCDCRDGEPGRRVSMLDRMARELGLSSEQQARIKAILAEERKGDGPLLKRLDEARMKMGEVSGAAPFDEGAVRAAAAKENEIRTELAVSHARSRSRINALLTPEQRELLEEMGPPPRSGMMLPGRHQLPPDGL